MHYKNVQIIRKVRVYLPFIFVIWNHDTGKSRKLNDEDMTEMQDLASDIFLMERGQSKVVTGKEHQERNDFIIGKQKEEMKRLDATRQYREHQLEMANKKMQETEHAQETTRLKNRIAW